NSIRVGCFSDFPAGQTAGDVNPIVGAEGGMADAQLRGVAVVEAGENDAALVRAAIAVRVLQKDYVWRASDEHTAAPTHDAVWKSQAVGEHRSFIKAAIAIGIFEQRDDAGRRLAFAGASGIAAIFDNIEAARFVERHSN